MLSRDGLLASLTMVNSGRQLHPRATSEVCGWGGLRFGTAVWCQIGKEACAQGKMRRFDKIITHPFFGIYWLAERGTLLLLA